MAKRIQDIASESAAQSSPTEVVGDGGLSELAPNATVKIAGIDVTVHEYGFFEGLEVLAKAPNFMAAFKGLAAAGEVTYVRMRGLFGRHAEEVVAMVAQSCDQPEAWIRALKDEDGEVLLATWFAVHAGFFVREAVMEMQENLLREAARNRPSTGSTSSPHLPPPGLEISEPLAASPSAN